MRTKDHTEALNVHKWMECYKCACVGNYVLQSELISRQVTVVRYLVCHSDLCEWTDYRVVGLRHIMLVKTAMAVSLRNLENRIFVGASCSL